MVSDKSVSQSAPQAKKFVVRAESDGLDTDKLVKDLTAKVRVALLPCSLEIALCWCKRIRHCPSPVDQQ